MMSFGLILTFLGFMLIYAGVKDKAPWDELKAALSGT